MRIHITVPSLFLSLNCLANLTKEQFPGETAKYVEKGNKTLDKNMCFHAYYVCAYLRGFVITSCAHCSNISRLL